MTDQVTRDQVVAKSELNAEIKTHAGEDILPSEISGNQLHQGHQFDQGSQFQRDAQFNQDHLGLNVTNDDITRAHILAKKDLNAEIKEAAGSGLSDHILPSAISHMHGEQFQHGHELQGERLAGLSGTTDSMMKDHILAKKEVNAEIKEHACMGSDLIMPSEIHNKDLKEDIGCKGERLAGLGSTKDDVMKDHILAKKELNAEIKEHATGTDQILPSDLSTPAAGVTTIHDGRTNVPEDSLGSDRLKGEMEYNQARDVGVEEYHRSIGEMIKEKVAHAALAVKETLQNLH